MAEILVENQVCDHCGADVRAGALFCYNCGGAVASEIAVVKHDKNETIDKTELFESVEKESSNGLGLKPKQAETIEIETEPEDTKIAIEDSVNAPLVKPNPPKEEKLKSAATMRGKSKLTQTQKVEVIWEEREAAPNVWFIVVALALAILAIVILLLAIRLK